MGFVGSALGLNTDKNNYQNVVQPQDISAQTIGAQNVNAQNVSQDPNVLAQQQSFANALNAQMNGQGPSVAQAMLNQQAQQNAENASSIATSQHGTNAGLALRQALQAQAAGNQQAAAQGVIGRNQEQLNATSQLGGQLNTMQGQGLQAGMANQAANLQAGLANQGANLQANLANQNAALNASKSNQAASLGAAQLNTQIAQGNQSTNSGIAGGLIGAIGSGLGIVSKSHGGYIQRRADGGPILPLSLSPVDMSSSANLLQKSISGLGSGSKAPAAASQTLAGGAGDAGGITSLIPTAMLAARGGGVPGKPKVKGDSQSNDTVPAMLSPGEIVIPRSHANDPEKARAFVEQELKKRKGSMQPKHHIDKMVMAHKALGDAISAMSEGGTAGDPSSGQDIPYDQLIPQEQAQNAPYGVPPEMTQGPAMPSGGVQVASNDPNMDKSIAAGLIQPKPSASAEQASSGASQSGSPQSPYAGLAGELADVQKREMGAVQSGAKAQSEAEANISKVYADQAADLKKSQDTYQTHYDQLEKEHNDLVTAYHNGQIDPHRVLGSTGSKITAAIAIALGGLGQGLMKSNHNMALDVINKAIDDDVNAQKENLGKTANLLTINMNRFHNLQQAEQVTRMQKMAAAQALIGQYSAKAGSQQALANGQQLGAQIQERMIPMKQDMAYRSTLSSLGQNGSQMNPEFLKPEDRERAVYVPGPGGQRKMVLASSPKDADKYKEADMETDTLGKKVSEGLKFIDEKGWSPGVGGVFDSEDSAQADSIKNSIVSGLGKLHDLNRLNDNEFEMYKKMVPSPGQLNSTAARTRFQYLAKIIQDKKNSAASSLLENYNPGSIREGAPKMGR